MVTSPVPDVGSSIDFYGEVKRFEVELIERALAAAGGHQRRAARLLGLKPTTLNAKIKHYGINSGGHPFTPPTEAAREGAAA